MLWCAPSPHLSLYTGQRGKKEKKKNYIHIHTTNLFAQPLPLQLQTIIIRDHPSTKLSILCFFFYALQLKCHKCHILVSKICYCLIIQKKKKTIQVNGTNRQRPSKVAKANWRTGEIQDHTGRSLTHVHWSFYSKLRYSYIHR